MEMIAVFRKEVWIDDNAFPVDKEEIDIGDIVRGMSVDELEKLVTEIGKTGADLDYIADLVGFSHDGPFTVIIDDLDLADFMIANGLDCPSANRNPNFYEDGQIVCWSGTDTDPETATVSRWELKTNTRQSTDETVDDIGFHNLLPRECYALGLDIDALNVAKARYSIDRSNLPYMEAFDIVKELRDANLSVRRPG